MVFVWVGQGETGISEAFQLRRETDGQLAEHRQEPMLIVFHTMPVAHAPENEQTFSTSKMSVFHSPYVIQQRRSNAGNIYMTYVAPLIALTVAFIGYQQFLLAKEKFKLDLFEKRFAIFKATETFISAVLVNGASVAIIQQFNRDTQTAAFLFGEDTVNFLKDLSKKAADLLQCNVRCNDRFHLLDDRELQEIARTQREIVTEFNQVLDELKSKFSQDLKFAHWAYGFIWRA